MVATVSCSFLFLEKEEECSLTREGLCEFRFWTTPCSLESCRFRQHRLDEWKRHGREGNLQWSFLGCERARGAAALHTFSWSQATRSWSRQEERARWWVEDREADSQFDAIVVVKKGSRHLL